MVITLKYIYIPSVGCRNYFKLPKWWHIATCRRFYYTPVYMIYFREHDKDPELFFSTMFQLSDLGLKFHLSVLGEVFKDVPGSSYNMTGHYKKYTSPNCMITKHGNLWFNYVIFNFRDIFCGKRQTCSAYCSLGI